MICDEAIELSDDYLVERRANFEARYEYRRFKAFFHKYNSDAATGEVRNTEIRESMKFFLTAYEMAGKDLSWSHPVSITIALHFVDFPFFVPVFPLSKVRGNAMRAYNNGLCYLDKLYRDNRARAEKLLRVLKRKIDDFDQE